MKNVTKKRASLNRINYAGSLEPVVERLGKFFKIGQVQDYLVIDIGYGDCNVIVKTNKGKFLAKIFQKERTQQNIVRYVKIMQKVLEAGVKHPFLVKNQLGKIIFYDRHFSGLKLVLMDYIEGKTLYELNRKPNSNELKKIVEQTAKINSISYRPSYIFDSWAIPNIGRIFNNTKKFIDRSDLPLIERVIKRFNIIPINLLPKCFVHGDLTKTNVLKSDNGDIYILDFSIANWYPRIQELAVIITNLLYDEHESSNLKEKSELIIKEYGKFKRLTTEEHKWLYDYSLAALAMEILGALQEKYINNNDTEETDYLLKLGRVSLRREFN
ncbi:MAG: phosphotransferase [Candidatus Levybacteria bacterium]|nr:phosphotransferase [Candidatus Levybacteria bacterium]